MRHYIQAFLKNYRLLRCDIMTKILRNPKHIYLFHQVLFISEYHLELALQILAKRAHFIRHSQSITYQL